MTITDKKSFEIWISKRPFETRGVESIALAVRAALRVFPIWCDWLNNELARDLGMTAIPVARRLLSVTVNGSMPTSGIRPDAENASDASSAATAYLPADFTAYAAYTSGYLSTAADTVYRAERAATNLMGDLPNLTQDFLGCT